MRRPQLLQRTRAVRNSPQSYGLCCLAVQLLSFAAVRCQAQSSSSSSSSVYIRVRANEGTVAVPPWFRSFTADWWRHNELSPRLRDNGAKWGRAGLLTADLGDVRLRHLAAQLAPAVWRIGGTPQDAVVYVVGKPPPPECATADAVRRSASAPGPLCLTVARWREIAAFADACGLKLVMGLNGMHGRRGPDAPFNISNAREFLRRTARLKLAVFAFELSNERLRPANGATPAALAADFRRVRQLLAEFWPVRSSRPLLLGPDSSERQLPHVRSFVEESELSGESVLDGLVYHSYCSSASACYAQLDAAPPSSSSSSPPASLNFWPCLQTARQFLRIAGANGRALPVWAGEVGPHNGGGLRNCSDRFANAFWYLHHLGSLARLGVQVFARSTLFGGDYGLLDKTTFQPRPDYFAALLWGRVMCRHHFASVHVVGGGGGRANRSGTPPEVPVFACRSHREPERATSVTLLLMNPSPVHAAVVELALPGWVPSGRREEYHVSADELLADEAMLRADDGQWLPLRLTADDKLPEIAPVVVHADQQLLLSPMSYAFVVVPGRSSGVVGFSFSSVRSLYAHALLLVVVLVSLRLCWWKACRSYRRLRQA